MNTNETILRFIAMTAVSWYYHSRLQTRGWLRGEISRNDTVDPPSERQLQWDLRHMREDLYMVVIALDMLVYLAIIYAAWHW